MFLTKTLDEKLGNVFERYGQLIARNPWTVIFFILSINGLLGLHIIRLRFTSDMERLYTPTNSQADRDRELIKSLFQDQSSTNFYPEKIRDIGLYSNVILIREGEMNILNESNRDEINHLHQYILNITVEDKMTSYNYSSLCAKRYSKCVIDGFNLLSDDFWVQLSIRNITYPFIEIPDFGEVDARQLFGGVVTKIGKLISAKSIKLKYNLRQDEKYKDISIKWEKEFVKQMRIYRSTLFQIGFSRSDSLNDEINDNTIDDIRYFSLTFTLMISYTSFVTAGGNCVSQRGWLGRAGVIASALSILASFGLSTLLGIDFINIVGVMPFLILGIGVNDMFILLSGLADAPLTGSVEKRIGITLRTSGLSVTITSLTDIIAFAVGATSVFMVVRTFCIYSVFAVLFCYINIMTFFVACMALHEKRVAGNRHCLTCQPLKSRDEMKKMGYGCCITCLCSGAAPASRHEQESIFEKIPRLFLPKIVLYKPLKFVIVIAFMTLFGFSLWGTVHLKQGFLGHELLSDESYFIDYLTLDHKFFPTVFFISLVFTEKITYSASDTFFCIESLTKNIALDPDIDNDFQMNWYTIFYHLQEKNNLSENNFTNRIKDSFLPANPHYANDITFNSDGTIKASRIYFKTIDIKNAYDQGKLMKRLRKKIKGCDFETYVYSPSFIYFEQYTAVLPGTIKTVCLSVSAVFVVTCLFLSHPLLILFVTGSMVMILVGLFGFMYYWNITLTTITLILILVGVGFSVDYSAHICYAFLSVDGLDRNVRVNDALVRAGGPIFNGAMTTIIGIMMLIFTKSYVFTSFFKLMILITLFGFGHSLFLLPVVLSIIGPRKESPKATESVRKEDKSPYSYDNLGYVDQHSISNVFSIKL